MYLSSPLNVPISNPQYFHMYKTRIHNNIHTLHQSQQAAKSAPNMHTSSLSEKANGPHHLDIVTKQTTTHNAQENATLSKQGTQTAAKETPSTGTSPTLTTRAHPHYPETAASQHSSASAANSTPPSAARRAATAGSWFAAV